MTSSTLRHTLAGAAVGALLLGGAAVWRSLSEGSAPDPLGLVGFTAVLGAVVGGLVGPLVGRALGRRGSEGS